MLLQWPVKFTNHRLTSKAPWPSRDEYRALTETSPVNCFYTVLGKDTYEICNVRDPREMSEERHNTITRLPVEEEGERVVIQSTATTAATEQEILGELIVLHLDLPNLV